MGGILLPASLGCQWHRSACQRKVETSGFLQSRDFRFHLVENRTHVILDPICNGVAPSAEIQGRGDDGAGSEESIGIPPLCWRTRNRQHRVLILSFRF